MAYFRKIVKTIKLKYFLRFYIEWHNYVWINNDIVSRYFTIEMNRENMVKYNIIFMIH